MKTEIIEAHHAALGQKEKKHNRETFKNTTCALCGDPNPIVFSCIPEKICLKCSRRTFSIGSARNPSDGSWETFWVIVKEGERPQYGDGKWLKTRVRGADGKPGWKRYCRWNKIRDGQLNKEMGNEVDT